MVRDPPVPRRLPGQSRLRRPPPRSRLPRPTPRSSFWDLLQQEGRLIDFLEEDVSAFSDAEIGAAARVVHEGCRKAVRDHFSIVPLRSESEGARVTLQEGFDPSAVRLTGNVVGKAPFTGSLVHRGWRAADVKLPRVANTPRHPHPGPRGGGAVSEPRFAVGIDLGTTNCAVSCAELARADRDRAVVETMAIPQLTAPGSVEERQLLPSFLYLPHSDEFSPEDLALPWERRCRRPRRGARPRPRGRDSDPARVEREELAVEPGRRPPRRDSPARRA